MTHFTFSIPTQIHFGPGAARQAGPLASRMIAERQPGAAPAALVIVDPGVQAAAWLKDLLASLKAAGVSARLFSEVKPNPREEDVQAAAALLQQEGMGVVIAIGGGSTLDTAKGAALLAAHGGRIGDYAGWGLVPGPVTPLIAIPTTAGSGSEATSWAVITAGDTHAKLAIGDPRLAPAIALVDPNLTLSLPPGLTAATGMDALTHAIEAFLSPLSNPVNDLLALESIRLVAGNIRQAVADGQDLAARGAMMLAATLGGVAINHADVAGVHCLSEGMGSLYDAPHGLLNAILLPYLMAYWLEADAEGAVCERFSRIAQAFGAPPQPAEAVARVKALIRSLDLPTLPQVGVQRADLPRLAALAEANVSNLSNPLPMAAADYQTILEQAMEGA